jgi:microcystin-dependent protein
MAQPFIGEIRIFCGNFAPAGWMLCQGQTLAISDNDILFELIGTTYGGDGQSTFNLPDLQSRVPLHQGNGFQLAETGGVETVTLTTQQIPVHNHTPLARAAAGANTSPAGSLWAECPLNSYSSTTPPNVPMDAAAVGPAGGSQPHDNMIPFLVVNFIISMFGVFPTPTSGGGDDPFLSEIKMVSFNFAPKGWTLCNGQLLPINQNQALFALLGTTYGGDGRVNFGLPNLQGRVPMHMGNGHTLGERGGEQAHTLNLSELPAHTHICAGSSAQATLTSPAGNLWGSDASSPFSPNSNTAMNPACITNTGGSQAHLNMSPYLTINFCIALQGIFPS